MDRASLTLSHSRYSRLGQDTRCALSPSESHKLALTSFVRAGFPTFPAELAGSSTREKFLDVKPTGVNASDVLLVRPPLSPCGLSC